MWEKLTEVIWKTIILEKIFTNKGLIYFSILKLSRNKAYKHKNCACKYEYDKKKKKAVTFTITVKMIMKATAVAISCCCQCGNPWYFFFVLLTRAMAIVWREQLRTPKLNITTYLKSWWCAAAKHWSTPTCCVRSMAGSKDFWRRFD